jgi:putative nucleotidyltransferase with HDIG domain
MMIDLERILVVDDDSIISEVLSQSLGDEGYSVTVVSRGDEVSQELEKQAYDLVMLDLMLPGIHGMQVFQQIRTRFPETDVIIMTGYASLESAMEAVRLGAQEYLTKPFQDIEIITRIIRKIFEKRRIIQENKRLTKRLKKKTVELEKAVQSLSSMNTMAKALHSILDIEEILHFLVDLIASHTGATRVSLMLSDQQSGAMKIGAAVGIDGEIVRHLRVPRGDGIVGRVAQTGEPLLVEDIASDPRFDKHTDRGYDGDSFISAPVVLGVPILYKQKTLGVINLNNKGDGGVFTKNDLDFVSLLVSQAAIAIENARLFEELKETHFQVITALAEALEAKDAATGHHSDRLLRLALQVADCLHLSEDQTENLRYAAVLHDIGKIRISEAILRKPGPLTPDEYEEIKKHPLMGAELVKKIKFLEPVATVVCAHHERYDGQGYPNQLVGEEIPIEARIVAVLDTYDAITSDRPYRRALGKERAIQELQAFAGRQFDPKVVDAFLAVLGERDMDAAETPAEHNT